jgi:predicted lipoprotein with Yx(FWY)xxD motif
MRQSAKALLPMLALSLTLAACGSSSSGTTSSSSSSSGSNSTGAPASSSASSGTQAVNTASNSKLGTTVLVDASGMTLYHLSAEQNGKFICTSAECEKTWTPVSAADTSSAISGLDTVKRPDGAEQLAYKGEPLYTFVGDKAPGEANGQGVKDVGTWSAVTTTATSAQTSTGSGSTPAATSGAGGESSSSGGSGGYGY